MNNLLTEDEAKAKWCFNDLSGRCVAGKCMAWRWSAQEHEQMLTPCDEAPPDGEGWVTVGVYSSQHGGGLVWKRPPADQRGCCGLAGDPK